MMKLYMAVEKADGKISALSELIIGTLSSYPKTAYYFQSYRSRIEGEVTNAFKFWKENSEATNWNDMLKTKLRFFTKNDYLSVLPFYASMSTPTGAGNISNIFVSYPKNGYSIAWSSVSTNTTFESIIGTFPILNIILGSEYENIENFDALLVSMKSAAETKFKAKIYNETFDNFKNSPLLFTYSNNASDDALRIVSGRSSNMRGLPDYTNWYTFMTGKYTYGNPLTLKLLTPIDNIEEIELSVPVTPIGTIDNGYDNECTFTSGDRSEVVDISSFLYVSRGTNLEYLFSLNKGKDILLNDAIIRREIVDESYSNYTPKYSIISTGESIIQSWFNTGSYRNDYVNCQWLLVNPAFATLNPNVWIGQIDENYSGFSFRKSPFAFAGEIYTYNTAIVKLPYYNGEDVDPELVEPNNLRCIVINYKNTISTDTYYQINIALINESIITFDFWNAFLAGNYAKDIIGIGEGSIGGGYSGTGGNNGTFDDTSGSFTGGEIEGVETAEGLLQMYTIDTQNLTNLSNDITELSKEIVLRADVMQFIISVKKMFVPGGKIGTQGTSDYLIIGNHIMPNTQGKKVSKQYARYKMGEYTFTRYFGNYLDFSPHTTMKIYLPFSGIYELEPARFYGGKLELYGTIDALSGTITYEIILNKHGFRNTIQTVNGDIGFDMPLTANNYSSVIDAKKTALLGIASVVVNPTPAGAVNVMSDTHAALLNTHDAMIKGTVQGIYGATLPKKCFLIFERPKMSLPETFASEKGLPSNISAKLSSIEGYTVVDDIHLNNIPATDQELEEIETLLKDGVIF